MNKNYEPDFRMLESIDQCVWITGSTNKETGESEKPEYCNKDCKGYDTNCPYYTGIADIELIILDDRYRGIKE